MGAAKNSPRSSGQRRYLATLSAQGAFSLAAGRQGEPASPLDIIPLGEDRGLELTFYGTGAANDTFDYRVWIVKRATAGDLPHQLDDYDLQLYCHGTATLGTQTGVSAASLITDAQKVVDKLTVTKPTAATNPKGIGGAVVTAYGSPEPTVYSPDDNTEARLFIPDLGGAFGVIVEFDMTGATGGGCLYERIT